MCANYHTLKHAATQPLHDSITRARAPNLVASQVGLTVGGSYSNNVTVNRYNGYIRGTNMIVRCLGVIVWTLVLMFIKLNSLR